jgi:Holliday junction resolvase RusA-like endonuclease
VIPITNTEYENIITISITQELVDEYNNWYKQHNPRSKKNRIESPLCITFNTYNSKGNRIIQNSYKQEWKSFIMWICKKQDICDLKITECSIHCHFTYDSKRRHDLDNSLSTLLKFSQDGLVEAGVIEDDTYTVLTYISSDGEYKKGIKQTDIIIRY